MWWETRLRGFMVNLGNNTKVLLTKYSNDVIIDDIGGELLLYNNNNLFNGSDVSLLDTYVFTGVSLEYLDKVVIMAIKDFYEKPLEYTLHNGYIFVKKVPEIEIKDPLCVVSFLVKSPSFVRGQLYAHFIEKNI